jgi:hypothetical protein
MIVSQRRLDMMERIMLEGRSTHHGEQVVWRMILPLFVLMAVAQTVWGQQWQGADTACARAARAVKKRDGSQAYGRALAVLVGCPVAGPRVLAEEWSSPPRDSLALEALSGASSILRDQRVYDAVKAVAENSTLGRQERLMAIQVLVSDFDPCLSIAYREPRYPKLGGREYVWFGTSNHYVGMAGRQPLVPTVREEVVATLRLLGMDDPDEVVRVIAVYLAERLGEMSEPVTCLH